MKVLFVGLDRQLFQEGTEACTRMTAYGDIFDEVHSIVYTKKQMGLQPKRLAKNVFLHPTNSWTKFNYIPDAINVGVGFSGVHVVSSQDPFESGLAAVPIARRLSVPLQIQMHIDPFNPYFKKETYLARLRPYMARYTLSKADCIRPVSERIKASVIAQKLKLRSEPEVLPVYVDVSRYEEEQPIESLREKYPQFATIVLMAGRLHPQKDIQTALRAFRVVVRAEAKTGLIIVGEGSEEEQLKKQVIDMGLASNVLFEGWKTDMLSFMKTCDVFLMTSTHEGYQRALGEAAAAGVPVVTTETGPVGSVYLDRDTVLACPVGDDACVARCLIELVRSENLRAELVVRAQKLARTAIAPSYKEYLQMYKVKMESCVNRKK